MKRLLVPFLALAVLALPAPAAALVDCSTRVVDEAGVMSPDEKSQAAAAATELEDLGADPYVRFIPNQAGSPTIDAYEQGLVASCPTFNTAGERKNNLVLLIVSMAERKAVLSWGQRWDPALAGQADRIRADFLNPALRDAAYGRAVQDTFGEVGRLVDEQLHPSEPEAGGEPTDLTPLWIILWAVLGIALLVAAGIGFIRYRAFRQDRAAARDDAIAARDRAATAIGETSQAHDELTSAVEFAKLPLGPDETAELDAAYDAATTAVGAASEAWRGLHGEDDDPAAKHRIAEYRELTGRYGAVVDAAAAARAEIGRASALAAELSRLAEALPAGLEQTAAAIDRARKGRDRAEADGYRVESADERIARADTGLADARAAAAAKQVRAASGASAEARALADDSEAWCDGLPALRARLEEGAAALLARIPEVTAKTGAAKEAFDQIAHAFAPDSWEPVRGNGSGAEERIAFATAAQTEAATAATMERQDWDRAGEALTAGNGALDEAERLLEAIHAMKTGLERAQADPPAEVAAAEADAAAARDYIRDHDPDLAEEHEERLAAAQHDLSAARDELATPMPNYLVVVKQARSANAAADAILVACRSEVEQLERLRAQAQSALRDADEAVSRASSYVDSHRSDVEGTAAERLQDAETLLAHAHEVAVEPQSEATADADQRNGLARQIELAGEAEALADEALQGARKDVHDAQQRASSSSSFFASSSSSGSSWSSGFSSFSSGGGGGGGSSSGGFGGGGGGSSSGGW